MADTKISALSAQTSILTTDVFPFNSAGTTKKTTFQSIIDNLAASYQPLNANLTTLSSYTPSNPGLNMLILSYATANSYLHLNSGAGGVVTKRTYAQVLSDIGAQARTSNLDEFSLVDPTTSGKQIMEVPDSGSAGYVNVAASGAGCAIDSYATAALNLRPYIVVPTQAKATSATTTWSVNFSTSDLWILTALAGNITISNPSPGAAQNDGSILTMRLKDSGSRRNLTWAGKYRSTSGATLPTATQNGTLYLQFLYNADDDKWDLILNTYA